MDSELLLAEPLLRSSRTQYKSNQDYSGYNYDDTNNSDEGLARFGGRLNTAQIMNEGQLDIHGSGVGGNGQTQLCSQYDNQS